MPAHGHSLFPGDGPLVTPEEVMAVLRYTDRDSFMHMARRKGIPRVRINARKILFDRVGTELWIRRRWIG